MVGTGLTVFEIVYPGSWVELGDRALAFRIRGYLTTIESRLSDAAVALHLFEQAQALRLATMRDRRDPNSEQQSGDEFRQLVEEYGNDAQVLMNELAKRALDAKRKEWLTGRWPRAYESRLPFLHARMFLFSLWDIGKLLRQVGCCAGVPAETVEAAKAFEDAFPMLKGLRDSSAHVDERVAGRARGKVITPKPVDTSLGRTGGLVFIENLLGNRFVGTVETGELAEIEVSVVTLSKVQESFQVLVNSLSWSGPPEHYPD